MLIPVSRSGSSQTRRSLWSLVANQEVTPLRMRGHQLEASAAPGWQGWPPSPGLSCVIIPSQLWRGPGPLPVLSPAPASLAVRLVGVRRERAICSVMLNTRG